jgi:hypothetical protein
LHCQPAFNSFKGKQALGSQKSLENQLLTESKLTVFVPGTGQHDHLCADHDHFCDEQTDCFWATS